MTFRILWGIDALVALVVLYFFFVGLADGSVSSFNIGLWSVVLLVLGGVLAGSVALRSAGYSGPAYAVLLILAVPAVLVAILFLAMILLAPDWR
jgi:hypothetical protein